jgi:hypothetical protein
MLVKKRNLPIAHVICLSFYGLAAFLATAGIVQAQPAAPHVAYVYPAGGRQGETFQATIGGQFLEGSSNVYISGSGVKIKAGEYTKPLTQKQAGELRDKIQVLLKKPKDADTDKEIAELRKKLATFVRMPNPALAERVSLDITIDSDAEPGQRELRLATASGLSNPIVFQVGQLAEFGKQEAKLGGEQPKGNVPGGAKDPRNTAAEAKMNITLPAIVNGQIMPGEVDRYRFQARKGQQVVVSVSARELIPYLADAVPGWFQAVVAIYDSNGKELAYDDHYRFHPDPVIYCKVPKDGGYMLEIRDSLYRGREDFVYRITIGELPFVTSIFPMGGPVGAQTVVELKGWNLPVPKLTIDAKDKEPGNLPLSVRKGELISNIVPFALDRLPECPDREPNNQLANAQQVALPVIVNGRIDKPGNWDIFCFEGIAGEEIVADVDARKLDSPLDSVLKLTDANGRQLAYNDDFGDKSAGLSTHQADSLLKATLPADGKYYLYLGDAQHQGGAEFGYRLRISEPRPDFALRVVPASINVRAGAAIPISVYALRKDGFADEIALTLKDAPKGFSLSGSRVPAKQDQVRLTITAPQTPLEEPVNLSIEGRAVIHGSEVVHPAAGAEDMMQAFIYHHLVPSKDLMVAVTGRGRPRAPVKFLGESPVKLPADGTAPVRFSMPRGQLMNQVQLTLIDPPDGITIQDLSPSKDSLILTLHADAGKVKPGLTGNLIVDAFTEKTIDPSGDVKQPANKRRVPLGTLPAIPFEIIKK